MIKYMAYRLFLNAIEKGTNVFISGNSKKSAQVMEQLRDYRMDKVYFNWFDKNSFNIVIHYDNRVKNEYSSMTEDTIYIFIGDSTMAEDITYILLSCYYAARRKSDDTYCSIMCV